MGIRTEVGRLALQALDDVFPVLRAYAETPTQKQERLNWERKQKTFKLVQKWKTEGLTREEAKARFIKLKSKSK